MDPVAIVGIGCLFPQSPDLETYWRNILAARDCITDVPEGHSWSPGDYYDPDPQAKDKTWCTRGGFLDALPFDPLKFGIPPAMLESIDTTQLLSLIVAREALRDAGLDPDAAGWDRDRVSVILGVTGTQEMAITAGARLQGPIWRRSLLRCGVDPALADVIVKDIAAHFPTWTEQTFPGLLGNVVAGRIANRLDLGGTNAVVDAACASSLAALQYALGELGSGRSDLVLTGGADTLNDIFMFECFTRTPAFSRAGDARPFDAAADGILIGEGIAICALKRLPDAVRDGDRVYAVLRGLGSSSDGRHKSIYAPNPDGQAKALRRTYTMAGIDPSTVELVEAHGTGTRAGDAAEIEALGRVYRESRPEGRWVALGSVKAQIGHTKSTAGAAGLVKAALALHQRVLPPAAKIEAPNPKMAFDRSPFYLSPRARPWIRAADHPRRAAVSAFGFGGSNFHAVLEEFGDGEVPALSPAESELFLVSGDSVEELKGKLRAIGGPTLAHAARSTLRTWTPDKPHVVAFLAGSLEDLPVRVQTALARLDGAPARPKDEVWVGGRSADGSGKVAFVFPGQGSQYVEMGRELAVRFPTVRRALDEADEAFRRAGLPALSSRTFPPPAWSAEEKDRQAAALRATEWAQPAIGALSRGLTDLLADFGLAPDLVAGHSYGELVALYAAGVLDADGLLTASRERGALMSASDRDRGTMAAVDAPLATIEAAVAGTAVVLANRNHPGQGVISGPADEVRRVCEALAKQGATTRPLPVAAAFHSPLVADARAPFRAALDRVAVRPARIEVLGCDALPYPAHGAAQRASAGADPSADPGAAGGVVHGVADGRAQPDAIRDRLADQLVAPVDWVGVVEALWTRGVRTFVEVGPRGVLAGLIERCLHPGDLSGATASRAAQATVVALDRLGDKEDGDRQLKRALAQLAAAGLPVNPAPLLAQREPPLPRVAGLTTVRIAGANHRNPETLEPPMPSLPKTPTSPPMTDGWGAVPSSGRPMVPPVHLESAQPDLVGSSPSGMRPPVTPPIPPPEPLAAGREGAGALHPGARATSAIPAAMSAVAPSQAGRVPGASVPAGSVPAAHPGRAQATAQGTAWMSPGNGAPTGAAAPTGPTALTAASAPSGDLLALLESTRATLAAFQDAQARTADVHARFLDGFARANDNFARLFEAQARLVEQVAGVGAGAAWSRPADGTQPLPALAPLAPGPMGPPSPMGSMGWTGPMAASTGTGPIEGPTAPTAASGWGAPAASTAGPGSGGQHPVASGSGVVDFGATGPDAGSAGFGAPRGSTWAGAAAIGTAAAPAGAAHPGNGAGGTAAAPGSPLGGARPVGPGALPGAGLGATAGGAGPGAALFDPGRVALPTADRPAVATDLPPIFDALAAVNAKSAPQARPATGAPGGGSTGPDGRPNGQADLGAVLIAAVAAKTGYPAGAIELKMDLESDLGVDSIKRVEILSAVREKVPTLPEVDNDRLSALRTLADVLAAIGGAAGGGVGTLPADPRVTTAPGRAQLVQALLSAVAAKTGYPRDALDLSMDLESDLGVDSIKRVEILSAVRDAVPGLPEVDNERLSALRTLDDVVGVLVEATSGPLEVPDILVAHHPPSREELTGVLLDAVARKTGFPRASLDLSMDLESDLGVDSIKRVEILSAVREALPSLPELDNDVLGSLRTLDDVASHLGGLAAGLGFALIGGEPAPDHAPALLVPPAADAPPAPAAPGLPPVQTASDLFATDVRAAGAEAGAAARGSLRRREVALVPAPERAPLELGGRWLITVDRGGLAIRLADVLKARGLTPVLIDPRWDTDVLELPPELARSAGAPSVAGAVHLAAVGATGDDLRRRVRGAFLLAKATGPVTRFVTVSGRGGRFGRGSAAGAPLEGALAGLPKTLAHEWPASETSASGLRDCRPLALDIGPDVDPETLADEILGDRGTIEVGLADGRAFTLAADDAPGEAQPVPLGPGDLVVATGGARGVTAAAVLALAKAVRVSWLLLGRSAPEPDPTWAVGVDDDALVAKVLASPERPKPREAERIAGEVRASREVRRTITALRALGCAATYAAVDGRDVGAVGAAIREAVGRHGPVRGVIHGAGVLADKRVADKEPAAFDRVFSTKVDGLDAVLAAVDPAELRVCCAFTSVAGRFGNAGQSDYAMANEALVHALLALRERAPGVAVKAVDWGPWDGGMVTPSLKAHFEAQGHPVIPIGLGAAELVAELGRPAVEVVIEGPRPRSGALPLAVPGKAPWMRDHRIEGRPVVPVAMVAEWVAQLAAQVAPDRVMVAIRELQVLKGIVLEGEELRTVTCAWERVGDELRVEIRGARAGIGLATPHYRAVVALGSALPAAPAPLAAEPLATEPYSQPQERIFTELLFHGPALQSVHDIEGMSDAGAVGFVRASAPAELGAVRGAWRIDPVALDGALQLMVLWVRERRGEGALPSALGSLTWFRPASGRLQVRLRVTSAAPGGGRYDADLVDAEGALVARITDGEYTSSVALADALRPTG